MDEPRAGDSSPQESTPKSYPDGLEPEIVEPPQKAVVPASGGTRTPPPPPPPDEGGEEDEGMLRMSFLDHLQELRTRIIRMLSGFGVAFLLCIIFAPQLWLIVRAPAADALHKIGKGSLVAIAPMEQFSIIYMWTPLVAAIFVSSPWILYQVWAFISPGLYKRERRWAVPFVVVTAGLFLAGGLFAYFVAFRYGLVFLLNIGGFADVQSMVSIELYFELFVNVMLGVSLVFELPVIIFFLTLLRIASPRWLMANSRYAILGIVILAAIVTPTPDAFNMMLFAVPMCALFFIGVFASYLLVLNREGRRFPWGTVSMWAAPFVAIIGGIVWYLIHYGHYHFVRHWPFLVK
jgi:sec-independent protein translocase protein TatC